MGASEKARILLFNTGLDRVTGNKGTHSHQSNATVVMVRNDRFGHIVTSFITADLYSDRHHFESSCNGYMICI